MYPLVALLTSVRVVFQRSVSYGISQSVRTRESTPLGAARSSNPPACHPVTLPHLLYRTAAFQWPMSELSQKLGAGDGSRNGDDIWWPVISFGDELSLLTACIPKANRIGHVSGSQRTMLRFG